VNRIGGSKLITHHERVDPQRLRDGTQTLGQVVFLFTDSIPSRREIWEAGIMNRRRTKLLIEARIGEEMGKLYTIDPTRPRQVEGYSQTLRGNGSGRKRSVCGVEQAIGPTSGIMANLAVWQFMRWAAIKDGHKDELNHEIMFVMRPEFEFITRNFE
jgi:hypothetical protein